MQGLFKGLKLNKSDSNILGQFEKAKDKESAHWVLDELFHAMHFKESDSAKVNFLKSVKQVLKSPQANLN